MSNTEFTSLAKTICEEAERDLHADPDGTSAIVWTRTPFGVVVATATERRKATWALFTDAFGTLSKIGREYGVS